MPTERQKKAVEKVSEIIGNPTKTKGEALREAGYSQETSETPNLVIESKGFKEAAAPIVKQLEAARQRAIDKLITVEDKADYRALISGIDSFTKNIELLEGRDTERQGVKIEIVSYKEEESAKN